MRPARLLLVGLLAAPLLLAVHALTARQDTTTRAPRKVAFLVGPSTYLHDFPELRYPARDVDALAAEFRAAGFDEVVALTDPPEGKNPATRAAILDRLEKLVAKQADPAKNVRRGDVVVVVLAGHGLELEVPDPAAQGKTRWEAFFAPADGKKGRPDTLVGIGHVVNDVLAPCGGRNLVLVDACRELYQPNRGRGVGGQAVALTGQSAILFSCSTAEQSWESEEVKHGVFTHAVLGVIRDAKAAGRPLSWSGLVSRVEEKMAEDAIRKLIPKDKTQTPVLAAGQVPATELFAAVAAPKRGPEGEPPAGDLTKLPGEKEEAFEYVIEGEKKKGTRRVLTVDVGGGEKMAFVRVPKGSFLMGAPEGEKDAYDSEKPQRRVEITKDFYLGMFEVTQAQYRAVTGQNPSHFKGDRLPVEQVSWDDAVAFCSAVSKAAGRKLELPSEAQWEYACRAGTATPFHFGSKLNGDLANCDGNSPYGTEVKGAYLSKTRDVGSYAANGWGLHDMHGNVWEWCRDYYGPYDQLGLRDPLQLTKQSEDRRVLRGGSCYYRAGYCRAAYRFGNAPDNRLNYIGFRVCLPLD